MTKPHDGRWKAIDPFDVVIPGTEEAVRLCLSDVLKRLAPLNLSEQDSGSVELVLAEALNNVVEHAFAGSAKAGDIRVTCALKKDGLHLAIIDSGRALPDESAPPCKAPEIAVDSAQLPEGGFGWFMIHTLAQEVRYARVADTNQLELRLAIQI